MKLKTLPFRSQILLKPTIVSSLVPGIALILAFCAFARPTAAQLTPNSGSQGFQTNEYDNFTGIDQGSFNPIDLIHRASMGPQRTLSEFQQDGQKQLNDAAEQFRRQQLELLQQRRLNNANVAPSPHPSTPEAQ